MKRRLIISIAFVVVAGAVTAGFLLRSHSGYTANYRFVTVDRGDIAATVNSTGTLSADTTVTVGAQVSGQITELHVDFNSRVRKGELIARLDPRPAELEVNTAEALVQQDIADSMLKSFTLTQATPLHTSGMMTDNDYVAAQAAFEQSKANLKSARVQLARAQQDLAYTYIYAPMDGVVQERDVQVGQTVASSFAAPQLFIIASDLRRMQILVQVDEADVGQIKKGQAVHFTVEAYPNRTYQGAVSQVRLQYATVQNVVDYTVVVAVNNDDGTLLPGMTATVNFETAKASSVLRIANAALRFRPSEMMLAAADLPQRRAGTDSTGARRQFTAADSARFRQMMAQRRAQGGAGGGTGGFGGGSGGFGGGTGTGGGGAGGFGAAAAGASNVAVLWTLDANGKPAPLRVHTGLTDGQMTEIVDGPNLKEGTKIIAAVTNEKSGAASNPFQAQQQQGGPGRRVL
ncbi:MAG TPA: efflux RND transporter periplasmic adaptor subunit [Gemmatimonadales bacterium]|nr:efflux RND transporter periplasmic adaptor subunit [Gemmatimonadales bacterium]